MATNSVLALASRPSKALNVFIWTLQILAAAAFLPAGALKLAGVEPMVDMFDRIGFGQWFRLFTGAVEVISAILLLIPAATVIGSALLAMTMLGAIATHLFILGGSAVPAVILLVMVSTVAWLRAPIRR